MPGVGVATLSTARAGPGTLPANSMGGPMLAQPESLKALKPSDLPAPPQAAARIIQACSDPEVSAQALSRIVASDMVLTAELLRTVNSAFFGSPRSIKTAAHAVTVLGNRALRNLALCLAVRDALKPDAIPGLDMLSYWEDALRRAVGAKVIGRLVGIDPDESFTIGLLQDFGMLAMLFALPGHASRWSQLRGAMPDRRRKLEGEIFGITHDRVALMLAKTWSLPPGLSLPMACHHNQDDASIPEGLKAACKVAAAADLVAAVFSAEDTQAALDRCHAAIGVWFSITEEQVDALLGQVPSGVEEAAESLGLRVKEQPRFEDIYRQASRRLVVENQDYQQLTQQLEKALKEKDILTEQLREANANLEKMAYYDPLTGLVNRRRFQEVFAAEVSRHSRGGRTLSLVMIDLDHFKLVNDNYGHPFGDVVLESVAKVLRDTLRTADTKARIGGEEMCVLLPETGSTSGADVAERIRKAVEAMQLSTTTTRVAVTASFGGASWSGSVTDRDGIASVVRRLTDAADAALYDSKRSGRNRVTWRSVTDTMAG